VEGDARKQQLPQPAGVGEERPDQAAVGAATADDELARPIRKCRLAHAGGIDKGLSHLVSPTGRHLLPL